MSNNFIELEERILQRIEQAESKILAAIEAFKSSPTLESQSTRTLMKLRPDGSAYELARRAITAIASYNDKVEQDKRWFISFSVVRDLTQGVRNDAIKRAMTDLDTYRLNRNWGLNIMQNKRFSHSIREVQAIVDRFEN